MAATNTKQFLDQYGLKYFARQIAEKMDQKIYHEFETKLVQVINDASSDGEIPSAAAVWEFVKGIIQDSIGVNFYVWEGDLDDGHPDIDGGGEPGTIYLVKVDTGNPDDNLYTQWIYQDDRWINLGSTACDISNLWSKDDLVPLSIVDINEILLDVFGPDWVPIPDPIDP